MTISNQDARSGPYNGNDSTTEFSYDFRILDQGHLVVTLTNSAGVETVQTITTEYTVSGVDAAGGGLVTMVTPPATGETLTISRAVPLTQEVDLVNRGGVQPEVLEKAYDKLTQALQDQEELHARVPRFPVSSSLTNIELPSTLTANAVLQVNSGGTAFINGPTANDISGAQTYAADAAAALDEFTDIYLGAKASNPTLDNDGDALQDGALFFDTTLNLLKVYDLGTTTWKRTTPTTGEQANIDTVAGISSNVTTVAGISSQVSTVAGISTDVSTVSTNNANVTTVSSNITSVNTVAGIEANIATVAGISSNVTTVAGISADVTTAATNVADITNFADVYLGAAASDPSTRADTSALQAGDMYFNTTDDVVYVYSGSAWISALGVAATIAVGTVTTGAEGSSATVTNSGTSTAATFDFSIPVGATGATGAAGTDGLGFTGGSYNASTGVVTFTSDDGLGFSTGDLRGAGDLLSTNNLSDVANVATARANLDVDQAGTAVALAIALG